MTVEIELSSPPPPRETAIVICSVPIKMEIFSTILCLTRTQLQVVPISLFLFFPFLSFFFFYSVLGKYARTVASSDR